MPEAVPFSFLFDVANGYPTDGSVEVSFRWVIFVSSDKIADKLFDRLFGMPVRQVLEPLSIQGSPPSMRDLSTKRSDVMPHADRFMKQIPCRSRHSYESSDCWLPALQPSRRIFTVGRRPRTASLRRSAPPLSPPSGRPATRHAAASSFPVFVRPLASNIDAARRHAVRQPVTVSLLR